MTVGDNDHGDADPIRFLIARLRNNTYTSTDPQEAANLLEEMVDAIDDRDGVMESLDQLVDTCAKLQKERDEARRNYCEYAAYDDNATPTTFAAELGWDCFKENNND